MGKSAIGTTKFVSSIIAVVFLTTQPGVSNMVYGIEPQNRLRADLPSVAFPQNPENISVPDAIGDIRQFFKGRGKQTVVLVQDAHAIPDAQRSIQRIIEHFQKEYGLGLVGLEGAASELDPKIFKSFPDRELLRKTIDRYVEDAELVGSVAAAILSDHQSVYHGLEDWQAYEEGLAFFLAADMKRNELSAELKKVAGEIQSAKEKIYSPELRAIDRELGAFQLNGANLLDVLKKLAAVKPPEAGSELAVLLEQSSAESGTQGDFDTEVRSLAREVSKRLEGLEQVPGGREAVKRFQEKFQEFQTSRMTSQDFALFLRDLCAQNTWNVRFSKKLGEAVGKQKKMRDIEGTKLFEDFRLYAQSVKETLFRNEEEKKLDGQSSRLELFGKLVDLELDQDGWRDYQAIEGGGREALLGFEPKVFELHKAFYRNTEKRDQAFMRNLFTLMEARRQSAAMVITGGFHTEGLIAQLKAKNISYVLIMPKMRHVPPETPYREQMRGHVSWRDYFKVENGKVSLYKAFVRGVRDRLLKQGVKQAGETGGLKSSPPNPGSAQLLKSWRDQIIRDLASAGAATDASKYTVFMDEKFKEGDAAKSKEIFEKIDRFVDGLKQLDNAGDLNAKNVIRLLQTKTFQPGATGGANSAPGDVLTVESSVSGQPVNLIDARPQPAENVRKATARQELRMTQAEIEMESLTDETADDLAKIADQNQYWERILQLMIESNDRSVVKRDGARAVFVMNRFDPRIADLLERVGPDKFFRSLADKVASRFIEQETEKALQIMVRNAIELGMEDRLRDLVRELAEDEGRRVSFLMSDPDDARREVMSRLLASPKYAGAYFDTLKSKVLAQLDGMKVYRSMGKIMQAFGSQMTWRKGHQYMFLTYDQMVAMIGNSALGNREIPGSTMLVTYDGEYVALDELRSREERYRDVDHLFLSEIPMSLVAFDVTAVTQRPELRSVDTTANLPDVEIFSRVGDIGKYDPLKRSTPFSIQGSNDKSVLYSNLDDENLKRIISHFGEQLPEVSGMGPSTTKGADAGFGGAKIAPFEPYKIEPYKETQTPEREKVDLSSRANSHLLLPLKGKTPYQIPVIAEDAVRFMEEVREFMRDQKKKGKEKIFLLKDFVAFMENLGRAPEDMSDLYGRLADYQAMADQYDQAMDKIKGEIKDFKEDGKSVSPETKEMLYRARDQVYELLMRLQILRRDSASPDSESKKLIPLLEGLIGQLTRKLTQREKLLEAAGLPIEQETGEDVSAEQLQSLIRSGMEERAMVLGRPLQASDMVEVLRDMQVQGFIPQKLEMDALDEEKKLAIAWTNESGVMVPMDDPQLIVMALDGLTQRREDAIDEIANAVESKRPVVPEEEKIPGPAMGERVKAWFGQFKDSVADLIQYRQEREAAARLAGQKIDTSSGAIFTALQLARDIAENKVTRYFPEKGGVDVTPIEGRESRYYAYADSNQAAQGIAENARQLYEYLWGLSINKDLNLKYPQTETVRDRERQRFVETALRTGLQTRVGERMSRVMTENEIVAAAGACSSPLVKQKSSDAYRILETADAKMAAEYSDDFVKALTLADKKEIYSHAFEELAYRTAQSQERALSQDDELDRSELRVEVSTVPEDDVAVENFTTETLPQLLEAIRTGKDLGDQAAQSVVLYVRNQGFDQLAEAMRSAVSRAAEEAAAAGKTAVDIEVFNAAVEEVIRSLQDSKDKEKGGTIGLVLPAQLSSTFIKHFVEALGASHLEAVAVLGKLPTDLAKKIRDDYGVTIRSLNDYLKQRMNKPIPTGVFDSAFKMDKVRKMYGFKVDMKDVPEDDVLARDFAEFVQLAAVITADRLLRGDRDGKLASPEALKESLVQQLNIFDRAIELDAQGQFVVKAVIAKAILEERAREKVRAAA